MTTHVYAAVVLWALAGVTAEQSGRNRTVALAAAGAAVPVLGSALRLRSLAADSQAPVREA